jgi:hypothetical protein
MRVRDPEEGHSEFFGMLIDTAVILALQYLKFGKEFKFSGITHYETVMSLLPNSEFRTV